MWKHAARARERIGLHAESLEAWTRAQSLCRQMNDSKGQLDAREGIARAIRQSTERPTRAYRHSKPCWTWRRRSAKGAGHSPAGTRSGYSNGGAIDMPTRSGISRPRRSWPASRRSNPGRRRPEQPRRHIIEVEPAGRGPHSARRERHPQSRNGAATARGPCAGRPRSCLTRARPARPRRHRVRAVPGLRRAAGNQVGEAWMWRRIAETQVALGNDTAAQAAANAAVRVAATSGNAGLVAACAAALPTTQF